MKKKCYIPDNIVIIIVCVFMFILGLIFALEGINVFIIMFLGISNSNISDSLIRALIGLLFFVPLVLFSYQISLYLCYTIVFDNEKIFIREDTNSKRSKIQYYTYAEYKEINSIDILWTNTKSNGEKSGEHSITGGEAKIPYLRIITKNNDQRLFMIMFTSKKTVKKIICEIEQRAKNVGNNIQLDDIDFMTRKL